MITASLANAFIRFAGQWQSFWTVLLLQCLFGQALVAFIRGKTTQIAAGGALSKKADPVARAGMASLAVVLYLICFCYEPGESEESIYEKRASDWTMPTREEIGRSANRE
ncbi:hypothetical protein [Pseudomonas khorasanensis]|nr:hypothetical protein [Pseudomonas khorasanensis]